MDKPDQSNTQLAHAARASAPPRRDTDAIAMGPESAPSELWMVILSTALVLLAGLCFYLVRGGLAPALDEVVPAFRLPAPPQGIAEEVETAREANLKEPAPIQELNLVCSLEEIEAALDPLLGETEELLLAGQSEVLRFKGMNGKGGSAQALRNQWAGWGGIWHNRVALLRSAQPPRSTCAEIENLVATCDVVDSVLYLLQQVPTVQSVREATATFSRAQEVLEEFRRVQEETTELERLEEEVAAENTAARVEALERVAKEGGQPASVPP